MRGLSPSRVQLSVQCFANFLSAKCVYPTFTAFIVRLRVATKLVEVPENTFTTFSLLHWVLHDFPVLFPLAKYVFGLLKAADRQMPYAVPTHQTCITDCCDGKHPLFRDPPFCQKRLRIHLNFAHIR